MAATLEIESLNDREFQVRVIEGQNESSHRVTLAPGNYKRLTDGKIEPRGTGAALF
jgi:hypothetical protein